MQEILSVAVMTCFSDTNRDDKRVSVRLANWSGTALDLGRSGGDKTRK